MTEPIENQKAESEPGAKPDEAVDMAQYKKRFKDAVVDAQYMLNYASGKCPEDINQVSIDKLIDARHRVEKGEELSTEEEAGFWLAYQELWKLIQPATAESIKANHPIEKTFISKLFGNIPILSRWLGEGTISKARRTLNWYIFFTVLVLMLLLILQIYWVIGNQLSAQMTGLLEAEKELNFQIDKNQNEYNALEIRYKQNEIDSGNFGTSGEYIFYSSPEWARDTFENISTRDRLTKDLESLESQIQRNAVILLLWSSPWDRLVSAGYPEHTEKYAAQFAEIDAKIAEIDAQLSADPDGAKAAEGQKNTLEAQLADLETQLKNADQSQKSALEAKKTAIQEKINLVHQKGTLEALLTSLEANKESIQGQIEDLIAQKSTLEAQLPDFDANKEFVQGQINDLYYREIALEAQLPDLEANEKFTQGQIQALVDQINPLEAQLLSSLSDADKESIQGQINELIAQKSTLEEQMTGLKADKEGIQGQIQDLIAQRSALEAQLPDLDTNKQDTQVQIDQINNQLSADPESTNAIESQKNDLVSLLADLETNEVAIQTKLNEMINPTSAFAAQLTGVDAAREVIQGQIVGLQSKIEILPSVVNQPELAAKIVEKLVQARQQLMENRRDLELQEQEDSIREDSRPAQLAGQFVLDILQGYLLPLLYGLLGAGTSVLRFLSKQIEEVVFSEEAGIKHLSRISLGALAGIMVGWFSFLLPKESTSFLGSVSPLAIAFLVGYNIELFFSTMDVYINRIIQTRQQQTAPATEKVEPKVAPQKDLESPSKQEKLPGDNPVKGEAAG